MIDINKQRQCNVPGWSHHQIVHFTNGDCLLIQNVEYIWEARMVHIIDAVGVEYVINKHKVNYYERVAKGKEISRAKSSKRSKRGTKKQA